MELQNGKRHVESNSQTVREGWVLQAFEPKATDILLDTSTNDGLNLIPFTFYAAHSQAGWVVSLLVVGGFLGS